MSLIIQEQSSTQDEVLTLKEENNKLKLKVKKLSMKIRMLITNFGRLPFICDNCGSKSYTNQNNVETPKTERSIKTSTPNTIYSKNSQKENTDTDMYLPQLLNTPTGFKSTFNSDYTPSFISKKYKTPSPQLHLRTFNIAKPFADESISGPVLSLQTPDPLSSLTPVLCNISPPSFLVSDGVHLPSTFTPPSRIAPPPLPVSNEIHLFSSLSASSESDGILISPPILAKATIPSPPPISEETSIHPSVPVLYNIPQPPPLPVFGESCIQSLSDIISPPPLLAVNSGIPTSQPPLFDIGTTPHSNTTNKLPIVGGKLYSTPLPECSKKSQSSHHAVFSSFVSDAIPSSPPLPVVNALRKSSLLLTPGKVSQPPPSPQAVFKEIPQPPPLPSLPPSFEIPLPPPSPSLPVLSKFLHSARPTQAVSDQIPLPTQLPTFHAIPTPPPLPIPNEIPPPPPLPVFIEFPRSPIPQPVSNGIPRPPPLPISDGVPPPPPLPVFSGIPPPPPLPMFGEYLLSSSILQPVSNGIPRPPPFPMSDGVPPPPPLPVPNGIPPPPPLPMFGEYPVSSSILRPVSNGIPFPPPLPVSNGIPPPPPLPMSSGIPQPPSIPPPPPMFDGIPPPPPMSSGCMQPLSASTCAPTSGKSPHPFPAPPTGGWKSSRSMFNKQAVMPKIPMKPLYWTRIIVPTTSEANTPCKPIWSEVEEMILQNLSEFSDLFSRQVIKKKATKKKTEVKPQIKVAKVLDNKRSQNVGILSKSLHVDFTEIENAINSFDTSVVSLEALEQIYEARATTNELQEIKQHLETKPEIPLDKPEKFLFDLSEISNFTERLFCIMFQNEFYDSIDDIENILSNIKTVCNFLTDNRGLIKILSIVLTLGNYMNGNNLSRGQADGYGLDILSKLKDVKSNDSEITLLHFIVRTFMKEYDYISLIEMILPVPDPDDIRKASTVNFEEICASLQVLEKKLENCENKIKKVLEEATGDNLQPFQGKMERFLTNAKDKLKTEFENLEDCKNQFLSTMKKYQFKPKSGAIEASPPSDFFDPWYLFSKDFKDIWKKELIRIEKEKEYELKLRQAQLKSEVVRVPIKLHSVKLLVKRVQEAIS